MPSCDCERFANVKILTTPFSFDRDAPKRRLRRNNVTATRHPKGGTVESAHKAFY